MSKGKQTASAQAAHTKPTYAHTKRSRARDKLVLEVPEGCTRRHRRAPRRHAARIHIRRASRASPETAIATARHVPHPRHAWALYVLSMRLKCDRKKDSGACSMGAKMGTYAGRISHEGRKHGLAGVGRCGCGSARRVGTCVSTNNALCGRRDEQA